jgi:hypothetical protein
LYTAGSKLALPLEVAALTPFCRRPRSPVSTVAPWATSLWSAVSAPGPIIAPADDASPDAVETPSVAPDPEPADACDVGEPGEAEDRLEASPFRENEERGRASFFSQAAPEPALSNPAGEWAGLFALAGVRLDEDFSRSST